MAVISITIGSASVSVS